MSDQNTPGDDDKTPVPEAPGPIPGIPNQDTPIPDTPIPDIVTVPGEVPEKQLREIIGALQSESEELRNQNLRLLADIDNLRKRTEREKDETAKYAVTRFARDVVGVADNFERAIQTVPQGAVDADATLKGLVEGVTMTERELINVLERYGVKRLSPKGEPFDPHKHQAMMETENVDVAPGTIIEVYQAGYTIEERILRPAMVVVAKGGAKPPAKSETQATKEPPAGGGSGDGGQAA
jgi:molecular chaperone GrpE